MIIRKIFVWILGTGLLVLGCEKPFDPAVEEVNELVVISNFTDTDTMTVVVSDVLSSLDGGGFAPIPDARVRLFEGDVLVEEMKYFPGGGGTEPSYFRSNSLIPAPNVIYTIEVIATGFPGVRATNYVPDSVAFADTFVYNTNLIEETEFTEKVGFDIQFGFLDQLNLSNYYHINFYRERFSYKTNPGGDTTLVALPSFPLSVESENGSIEMVPFIENRGYLLTDESFANGRSNLTFSGEIEYGKDQLLGDFIIEVRSVTEAYFRYYVTLARQKKASGDPLADPVILYSNIIKGQGIFAGYNPSFLILEGN